MTSTRQYRNRNTGTLIEAMQVTGSTIIELLIWLTPDHYRLTNDGVGGAIYLTSPNRSDRVWLGNWVIRDSRGHYSRIDAATFHGSYELHVPLEADSYYVMARDSSGDVRANNGCGLLLARPGDTVGTAEVWISNAEDAHHRRLYTAVRDFLASEGGQS